MNDRKLARNYATALFDLALERGELERVEQDLKLIGILLEQNPELVRVMANPVIPREKKDAIMEAVLGNSVQPLTSRFIKLLTQKKRLGELAGIIVSFHKQYKRHHGIVPVSFVSAKPIDDTLRDLLTKRLIRDLQAQVELEEHVDSRVVGGFVVQVEDQRYDASLRHKLDKLGRQFNANIYKRSF
jgi:F-type H+-transporting ATPase subunit delta